jgi:transcriptional regulator with GAF, ATPase, and Fis domain
MDEVFVMLSRVAKTELSSILVGETGTGKELAARAIHEGSPRKGRPFVVVDCGAISESLIESELFGHEKGAFTGADQKRIGAFEAADGGTVFLDELGELSIDLQPKLLRVLERREIKRLGSTALIPIDVRVICATHRDLASMVSDGRFREDLYYRLAEVIVRLPPLRARREDVLMLAQHVLDEHAASEGVSLRFEPSAIESLERWSWPGNVRELRNVVRSAALLASGGVVRAADLRLAPRPSHPPPASAAAVDGDASTDVVSIDLASTVPIQEARERWTELLERQYLRRVLARVGGDLTRAAAETGVHRKSLERLLRRHGLS